MNEERAKELFSNEEYVRGLVNLGSYEAASAKLREDGLELSAEDLRKLVELVKKKAAGELTDEDLEDVSGGLIIEWGMIGAFFAIIGAGGGVAGGIITGIILGVNAC